MLKEMLLERSESLTFFKRLFLNRNTKKVDAR